MVDGGVRALRGRVMRRVGCRPVGVEKVVRKVEWGRAWCRVGKENSVAPGFVSSCGWVEAR